MKQVNRMSVRLMGILFVLFVILALAYDAQASVTIQSFSVKVQGTTAQVSWQTATELNNAGFNILRSTSTNGTFTKINSSIIPPACFGCITGSEYSYNDTSATSGQTYYYKLQSVDASGSAQLFGPVSASSSPSSSSSSSKASSSSVASSSSSSKASSSVASSVTSSSSSSVASSVASSSVASSSSSVASSSSSSVASSSSSVSRTASSSLASSRASSAATSTKIALVPSSSVSANSSRSAVSSSASPEVNVPPSAVVSSQLATRSSSQDPAVVIDEPVVQATSSPLRVVGAGMFIGAGFVFLGALGLGAAALFFFLRIYVR